SSFWRRPAGFIPATSLRRHSRQYGENQKSLSRPTEAPPIAQSTKSGFWKRLVIFQPMPVRYGYTWEWRSITSLARKAEKSGTDGRNYRINSTKKTNQG